MRQEPSPEGSDTGRGQRLVGWLLLFYDIWYQLIHLVSCIMGRGGGGRERGGDGRQGVARRDSEGQRLVG